ncbi:MAG: hypothetical protein JSS50_02720 [Proteobacteria bacterium]|nr:hypothetical protein [Pseudomonadota bacterium]
MKYNFFLSTIILTACLSAPALAGAEEKTSNATTVVTTTHNTAAQTNPVAENKQPEAQAKPAEENKQPLAQTKPAAKPKPKVGKQKQPAPKKQYDNTYPHITKDNILEEIYCEDESAQCDSEKANARNNAGSQYDNTHIAQKSAEAASAQAVEGCPLTPEVWEVESYPATHHSNDLRRTSGSPYLAQGKMINLVGRVLDQNCVPVTGARIQLVQADSLGHYSDDKERDRGFTGSGITFTDNLGRYSFFSIMPGPVHNRAPHIRFSIDHPEIQHFETEMFFPDNLAVESDPMLRSQVAKEQRHLLISKYIGYNINEGIDVYEFAITLNGSLNYKTY